MNKSLSTSTQHASLFQTNFPPEEFSARRAKVFDQIGDEMLTILQGSSQTGEFDIFRQSNEFYYLCGVEVPGAYLLLDGKNRKTILYLPGRKPQQERSEGPILNSDDVELTKTLTGVDEVRGMEALLQDLAGVTAIYTPHSHANWGAASEPFGQPTREAYFIDKLKALCPHIEVRDLSPIISSLRLVKSPAEIDVMRFAGRLSALAVTEAMRCTKPGIMEYQLGAVADYIYLVNGARGGAYRPIIAGGANAWHGHYYRNNCELRDGDLVLMDYAPDYSNYTSDIGRMWPVNGKYATWQRELYGFIVEYHKVLLKLIRPGVLASQIMDETALEMKQVLERTTFSKPCYEAAARKTLEFRGHLSHGVGMEVHDSGNYTLKPLVPGTVFAVDPQMWIPEEQLYIRVEDTVVVTQDGIENLTQPAPLELDDVEKLMKEEGILQKLPPLDKVITFCASGQIFKSVWG
ncbi:aminopeptidase P family protein [Candidatus Poribacteria bacterium]|nr:aminopeptidase P family protein [Candidatus Poribacteria bacterium]